MTGGKAVPVSASSLPLPTGASSAANQAAIQTPVSPAAATSTNAVATGGRYHSTADTLTDGQEDETQFGPHGETKVCVPDPTTGLCPTVAGNTAVVSAQDNPNASTQVEITAEGGNAIETATMAAVGGKTNYVCGVTFTAAGSTSALVVTPTITGLTNTLTFVFTFPAGVTTAATTLTKNFRPCLPASAANTAINAILPAGGSGNTAASAEIDGYVQ